MMHRSRPAAAAGALLQTRGAVQLIGALRREEEAAGPATPLCFGPLETRGVRHGAAGGQAVSFLREKRRHRRVSDLVVNVRGALGRHLLDYVHGVPVVPADLLVVGAEDTVRSPQRDDNVTGLRAVVVAAAALGRGQRAERQRGRVLRRVLAVSPPVLEQQDHQRDDDDDEDDAS